MRFWDSSAVVPLVFHESATEGALELYRTDPKMLVWTLTSTEVLSALFRRLREGILKQKELSASYERLQLLVDDWSEVHAIELVKQRAERLLRVHALRAADSLQLGAALVAVQERPKGIGFVSYDQNLTTAADKEGFVVLPAL